MSPLLSTSTRPISIPILILLAILCLPTKAGPTTHPPPPSPPPPPPSTIDETELAQHLPSSIPLYHQSSTLRKRSSRDATLAWALAEAARVNNRYGPNSGIAKRQEPSTGEERIMRLETAISVAGFGNATSATTTLTSSSSSTSLVSRSKTSTASGASPTSSSSSNGTRNTTAPVGQVRIWNYDADLAYYASVGVGSPPQYMNVILDTGSADLWITGNACINTTGCVKTPLLNETASNSSIDQATSFSVKYGSGSASGDLFRDYVGFAGYNVSNQTFAVVDTISNDLLSGNMSGLLGLGWQPLAASGATPFWENLYNAGVLPYPGFAVQLTRFVNISSATSVEPGGLLTFGYLNTSLYQGDIHYTSIPNGMQSYWVIPMAAVAVNGTNVTMNSIPYVAIDTGTTLIGGPQSVVSQIYATIPGALAATGAYTGYYSYPCASKINVSLTFGNVTWPIASDDFNLGPFGSTNNVSTCLGAFFDLALSSSSKISWVIGAAFLKNVFSVYRANPPAVGFATLSNGSTPASSGNSSSGTNGTRNDGNLTQIPAGIYGPVGGTSSASTTSPTPTAIAADQGITTAIQAGQTSSRSPVASSSAAAAATRTTTTLMKRWSFVSSSLLTTIVAVGACWSLINL